MNQRELSSRGSALAFSLLELTVSLAVIGMLAAITMPVYRDALIRARLALVQSRCHDLSLAYTTFHLDRGYGPESDDSCVINPPLPGSDREEVIGQTDPYRVFQPDFTENIEPSTFDDPFITSFEFPFHLVVPPKRCFHSFFDLPVSKENGCVLASRGPDGHIDKQSAGLTNHFVQYSPTNGIASNGDLFLSVPEEEEVRLKR